METSNAERDGDFSPKGGKPGFYKVLDDNHLLIPELIGNRLFQGLINIQTNPKVGLLFMIPGIDKTVRVNGYVKELSPEALEKIVSQPEVFNPDKKVNFAFGLLVTINESYLHCPRSLKFADIWNEEAILINKESIKKQANN
jgi:predicted pyridoxine 5'-phosphate oxidase superfamily flavin-nucleotide-binding protein